MEKSIGKFINIEYEQLFGFEWKAPKVFVEMDTANGIPKELQFMWEGRSFL